MGQGTGAGLWKGEKIMKKIISLVSKADNIITFLCVLLLCALTIMVLASVAMRFFFSISIQAMEELCRYTFIAFIMLMCGPVVWRESHINVDLLIKKTRGKLRKTLGIINTVMTTAVLGYIVYWAVPWIQNIKRFGQLTSSQKFELWMPNMLVPIGLGLALLFAIALLAKKIAEYNNEDTDDDTLGEIDLDSTI